MNWKVDITPKKLKQHFGVANQWLSIGFVLGLATLFFKYVMPLPIPYYFFRGGCIALTCLGIVSYIICLHTFVKLMFSLLDEEIKKSEEPTSESKNKS